MYPQYMCILLYVKLIWCNSIPYIFCQLGCGGQKYLRYMCILLYLRLIWCSSIPYTFCQYECRGKMYPQYMCILLYVKHIWCKGIPKTYCQLQWRGGCILSTHICTFSDMCNLFDVSSVFHRCILQYGVMGRCILGVKVHSAKTYCPIVVEGYWMYPQYSIVHSLTCETYLVYQYSIDLLSIGVMGRCILSICAFCYM